VKSVPRQLASCDPALCASGTAPASVALWRLAKRSTCVARLQVDLDILVREDLMAFLKEESETRGCTVVYITHIFDGIEDWPTHIGFLASGGFEAVRAAADIPELREGRLMELVEAFLLKHKRAREEAAARGEAVEHPESKGFEYVRNNGYSAGRLASTLA
jgi:CCR4-NOT complex subunit CAF16